MRRSWTLLVLALVAGASQAAGEVHERRLDNGMKVIVKEDHRAPIVVSQVWYRVGSSYEYDGITGISHALEHMMFKGTEDHPAGEFSRIIAELGGNENAFTGRDYTAYFQTLSKERLETALRLEADRMRNLTLPADEFAKEIEVVKEERRLRTEDKPTSLTYEQFLAVAHTSSPYRQPVIGWMSDLDAMTIDDLRDWYRLWYAPNNATLVVVGDVEPEAVFTLVERHFGKLKPEQLEPPKPRMEAPQRGERRLVVRAPGHQPYLVMGYRAPALATAAAEWEPYALEMAAYLLDGGSSARLDRNLVRGAQLAASADADYSAFTRLPSLFTLDATPNPGREVAELEEALRAEVARLRDAPVTEDELERVRNQVIAGKVYERDSVFYQAMQIGMLETVGLPWRLLDEYVERLRAVTPEQVQEVARRYLVEERLTVAVLDPLPPEATEKTAANGGARHVY